VKAEARNIDDIYVRSGYSRVFCQIKRPCPRQSK